MRIGSLFSGAGGLDMAVESVFGGSTMWHSEVNKYASMVLEDHWPNRRNLGDIAQVDWNKVTPVDILCGGWPCQPWSSAGQQKGIEDERALWPEVARAVRELQPRYVVLENVPGIVVLGELARAVGDLHAAGYDTQWTCVSAGAVGAPHRRERMFILAHPQGERRGMGDTANQRQARGEVHAPRHDRVATANASGIGRNEGRPEPTRLVGGFDVAVSGYGTDLDLLPTPRASRGAATTETAYLLGGTRSDEGDLQGNVILDEITWGKYGPAIARWESLTRPAPSPTEPNSAGKPRLSPAFSEWLMGWPAGWVTKIPGIPRNEQLRIIGNGVVPQAATAALSWLLEIEEAA